MIGKISVLRISLLTGVHSAGSVAWLWGEEGIDLDYEEHRKECPRDEHDFCWPEQGTTLYGGWNRKRGEYHPDLESEYSAIYRPGGFTVQVISSRHVLRCSRASPCYPGQGDLDTPGDLWAYCLPPEMMKESWPRRGSVRTSKVGGRKP